MPKRKKKSDEQPLFIHFANLHLTEAAICDLFDKAFNYFDTYKGAWNIDEVKTNFVDTITILNELKKVDDDSINNIQRIQELFYKRNYFNLTKEEDNEHKEKPFPLLHEEQKIVDEIKMITKLTDDDDDQYKLQKLYVRVKDLLDFLANLKFSQLKLREILKKLIDYERLDEKSLRILDLALSEFGVELSREETSLRVKQTLRTFRGSLESHAFDPEFRPHYRFLIQIILPTIYIELVQYINEHGEYLLKQCPNCEKFHIAKRGTKVFCSDSCRGKYDYKKGQKEI